MRFSARHDHGPDYHSFHGYRPPIAGGDHIDWILGRGPLTSSSFRLIDTELDEQHPSDHFPLSATLELPG